MLCPAACQAACQGAAKYFGPRWMALTWVIGMTDIGRSHIENHVSVLQRINRTSLQIPNQLLDVSAIFELPRACPLQKIHLVNLHLQKVMFPNAVLLLDGTISGLYRDHIGTISEPYRDHIWTISRPYRDHIGIISRTHIGTISEPISGPYRDRIGNIAGPYRERSSSWLSYRVEQFTAL